MKELMPREVNFSTQTGLDVEDLLTLLLTRLCNKQYLNKDYIFRHKWLDTINTKKTI